jgi:hypothetical protein
VSFPACALTAAAFFAFAFAFFSSAAEAESYVSVMKHDYITVRAPPEPADASAGSSYKRTYI